MITRTPLPSSRFNSKMKSTVNALRFVRGGYAIGNAPWNRRREQTGINRQSIEISDMSLRSHYLLGIRLIARNGLNTLIVRIADRFMFSIFRQYSKALQPSHFLNFSNIFILWFITVKSLRNWILYLIICINDVYETIVSMNSEFKFKNMRN